VACSVVDEHDVVLVRGRWEPGAGPRVDDREVAVVVDGRRRGLGVVVRDDLIDRPNREVPAQRGLGDPVAALCRPELPA
jgi:hypothetical protein